MTTNSALGSTRSLWSHAAIALCAIGAAIAARATPPRLATTPIFRCATAPLVVEVRARGDSLVLDLGQSLALRVSSAGAPRVELPVNEDATPVIAALRVLEATRELPRLSRADRVRHGLEDGASVLELRCGLARESIQLGRHVSRGRERVVRRLSDGRAFVVRDDALRRLEHADVLLADRAVWPTNADSVIALDVELPGAVSVSLRRAADGTDTRRFHSVTHHVPDALATALAESIFALRAVNTRASRPLNASLVATLALRTPDDTARIRLWCAESGEASCVAESAISHSHLFVLPHESAAEIVARATEIGNEP